MQIAAELGSAMPLPHSVRRRTLSLHCHAIGGIRQGRKTAFENAAACDDTGIRSKGRSGEAALPQCLMNRPIVVQWMNCGGDVASEYA
jgi:hypothetical protein